MSPVLPRGMIESIMKKQFTLLFLVAAFLAPARLYAELKPEEIAILAIRSSKQSQELAQYYAQARGIPKSQICLLDIPAGETLSRADWDARVRPAIKRWLFSNELAKKIRCMVTVWDVPLKIGPIDPAHPAIVDAQKHLEAQKQLRQEQIRNLTIELDEILPADQPPHRDRPAADDSQKEYSDLLEKALMDARARIVEAQTQKDAEVPRALQRLEQLYYQGGGAAALVRSLQVQMQNPTKVQTEVVRAFELRRGELGGLRTGQFALSTLRESIERDQQTLVLLQQSDGLLGALSWIELNQDLWRKNETYSSFDNELAMLHFPSYGLLRWQQNSLHYSVGSFARESLPWTLMVARLEAPTFEQAKGLIDSAIEIEKTGLTGKFYIDARGIAADKTPGSYGDYDQSLRELAKLLKENTQLEVVMDDKDELFQSGDCPDAALYCGWYSLSKYVDAFTWKRGAVGYHLASGEAETLRKPNSNVWCKKMLERGVCATLGPTYEPYLTAFPRPLDFFPMLLTGKYTLAEVFARSNPCNSWVIVLVGDPLYNPYKNHPEFDMKNLPEGVARLLQDRR